MNPVRQEDGLGCAVACVAFVLGVSYQDALMLFKDGKTRVRNKANFYCPEIVAILKSHGKDYDWKKLKDVSDGEVFCDHSIVFVKRSKKYPYGHFLVRHKNEWMDPWINLPDKEIRAGFRSELPSEPTYVVYSV